MKKATRRIVEECNERILHLDLNMPYNEFQVEWRKIEADESSYDRDEFIKLRREILNENFFYKRAFNQKLSKIIKRTILGDAEVEENEE